MKYLKILLILALSINIVTFGLLYYHNLQPALQVPYWDSVCSLLFYLLIIWWIILALLKRKELFVKGNVLKTILVFLICTPAPLYCLSILTGQI